MASESKLTNEYFYEIKIKITLLQKGDSGFEKQVDRLFDLAKFLSHQIKIRPHFEMVLDDVNIWEYSTFSTGCGAFSNTNLF